MRSTTRRCFERGGTEDLQGSEARVMKKIHNAQMGSWAAANPRRKGAMTRMLYRMALPVCLLMAVSLVLSGQMRVAPLDMEQGPVALGLAKVFTRNFVDRVGNTFVHTEDQVLGLG